MAPALLHRDITCSSPRAADSHGASEVALEGRALERRAHPVAGLGEGDGAEEEGRHQERKRLRVVAVRAPDRRGEGLQPRSPLVPPGPEPEGRDDDAAGNQPLQDRQGRVIAGADAVVVLLPPRPVLVGPVAREQAAAEELLELLPALEGHLDRAAVGVLGVGDLQETQRLAPEVEVVDAPLPPVAQDLVGVVRLAEAPLGQRLVRRVHLVGVPAPGHLAVGVPDLSGAGL
eukprot:CAMPEP_0168467582 /NCGR_PEP_ID=MMETSP0228-20121227/57257_1 /TAXON_ID=133427 /ORGANISM="Protoceratium reticulatum, Strain CCCM 535 (=CCMP 1889)" /LENGTH=230 /DNA_ID=CAMNT_0008483297 /DNA_START=5 /DNA_END=694 /DNA_ORIENTATION=+